MKIFLTGRMTQTRAEMDHRFSNYGIHVMKKVSSNTDYLVTGINPGWSKECDAAKKNVTVLREKEFIEMMIEEYPEYML